MVKIIHEHRDYFGEASPESLQYLSITDIVANDALFLPTFLAFSASKVTVNVKVNVMVREMGQNICNDIGNAPKIS